MTKAGDHPIETDDTIGVTEADESFNAYFPDEIESIEFGNWFFYAKDIIAEKAVVELNSTCRTNDESIKKLFK